MTVLRIIDNGSHHQDSNNETMTSAERSGKDLHPNGRIGL